jgi:hypothetical protein
MRAGSQVGGESDGAKGSARSPSDRREFGRGMTGSARPRAVVRNGSDYEHKPTSERVHTIAWRSASMSSS